MVLLLRPNTFQLCAIESATAAILAFHLFMHIAATLPNHLGGAIRIARRHRSRLAIPKDVSPRLQHRPAEGRDIDQGRGNRAAQQMGTAKEDGTEHPLSGGVTGLVGMGKMECQFSSLVTPPIILHRVRPRNAIPDYASTAECWLQ
jgi:hypothetical protein